MPKAEYHIVIVGSGNMAHAMGRLLSAKHRIVQVVSRNEQTGKSLAKKLKAPFSSNIKDVYRQADFYLLCVPDDQVGRVSKQLKQIKGVLVHHSGAMPLDVLQSAQKAVLYPFVSVNPQTVLNKKNTALYYNTNHASTAFMLQSLLQGLRCQARPIDDGSRLSLHLAGVLVNNFTNHLYYRASVLTAARPQAHEALVALAEQALAHFRNNTNLPAQTGPARRNDSKTLKKHLTLIKKDPELSGIYLSLSRSIRKTYHP